MADRTKWVITGPDAGGVGVNELTGYTGTTTDSIKLPFPENHTDKDRVYKVKFMDYYNEACTSKSLTVTVKSCGTDCECGTVKATYNGQSFFQYIDFAWDCPTTEYQSILVVPASCVESLKVGAPGDSSGSDTYETDHFRCVVVDGTESKRVNLYVKGDNESGDNYEDTISIKYTEANCTTKHTKAATLKQAFKQDSSCTSLNTLLSKYTLVNYTSRPQAVILDVNPNGCMAKVVKGSDANWLNFRWCNDRYTYSNCSEPGTNVEQSNGERYLWIWPASNATADRSTTLTFTIDGVSTYSQTVTVEQVGVTCEACAQGVTVEGITLVDSHTTTSAVKIAEYSGIESSCALSTVYELKFKSSRPSGTNCFIDLNSFYFRPLTTNSGEIYAKITAENTTETDTVNTFGLYLKSTEVQCKTFDVTQPREVACDCSNAYVGTVTPVEIAAKPKESDYWASFTANSTVCTDVSVFTVNRDSGEDFVNVGSVTVTRTSSTYKLSGGIPENTTTEERKEKLKLLVNGDSTCTNIFEITQKGKANCNCGNVTGILNISATPTGGVLLGRFTGGTECVPSDFKVVKYYDENIVAISDVVINGSNGSFSVYANITKQNTNVNGRTQQLLVQKVSDGQMCGGPFLIEQQGTEPKCIVELSVSKGNESDCGVNFKVKEKCSNIDNYDVIEWGWSTNNVPNFNGQAFGAISAIGEDGITQDANVQETTLTNYHIWWRNRTVPSVSGTTTVQLKKCEQGQYDVILKANKFLNSGEVGTIEWGDGTVSSFPATTTQVQHTYTDGNDSHDVIVKRNGSSYTEKAYQKFELSRTVTSATICDCDAIPTLTGNYVFRWYDADTINIDVNTNGCGNMYVMNGDPSATWCNAEFINDGKTLSISIDKSPGEMLRHTILFYGIKAGTAQDPTSSKYECNWLYVGQGGVVECEELHRKVNGESAYLQFNDTTTTMLDYVKCINIKDIKPSDITYDPYDGDYWSWEDYQRYGTNWITGCTWLPNGGLKIDTTLNGSSFPTTVARGATIAIKLITDNQTTCANIRVIQYCEHCMGD